MKVLFVLFLCGSVVFAGEVPAEVKLIDGRVLDGVSSVQIEADGRVKIDHSAGGGRYAAKDLSVESRVALGMKVDEAEVKAEVDVLKGETVLKTLTGKEYVGVKDVTVTAAHLNFSHEAGLSRVLLKDLPEEIRERCGYDEGKAAAFLVQEREAQIANERWMEKEYAAYESKQSGLAKERKEAERYARYDKMWAEMERTSPMFRSSSNSRPCRPQYLLSPSNVDEWTNYYLFNPRAKDYAGPLGNGKFLGSGR